MFRKRQVADTLKIRDGLAALIRQRANTTVESRRKTTSRRRPSRRDCCSFTSWPMHRKPRLRNGFFDVTLIFRARTILFKKKISH